MKIKTYMMTLPLNTSLVMIASPAKGKSSLLVELLNN